jgi:hypothetical protein
LGFQNSDSVDENMLHSCRQAVEAQVVGDSLTQVQGRLKPKTKHNLGNHATGASLQESDYPQAECQTGNIETQ